jgi:lytic murein transglycosylase
MRRRAKLLKLTTLALSVLAASFAPATAADKGFRAFLVSMYPAAAQIGVTKETFNRELSGLEPDYSLPDLVLPGREKITNKGQAEFTRSAEDYLSRTYLAKLAAQGRKFLAQHRKDILRIEKNTGVDRNILVAIWGRETAYGTHKLPYDAIRVLATQAYVGRRKEMFQNELIHGLKMIQDGVPRAKMRSSWAGAVGLTQFMPSEFYSHAADGDGDGKSDLFDSVADALASAAMQLKNKGWVRGESWGVEVRVPPRGDCSLEGPPGTRSVREWQTLGFTPIGAKPLHPVKADQPAYLMMPSGAYGPAFLAFENFKVIRAYNTSDLYALFVGNLADRIAGNGGDFATPWSRMPQPPAKQVHEIQSRLKALGMEMDKIDGKIGSNTRRQIGAYQKANNLKIDCWPTEAVLMSTRTHTSSAQ